MSIKEFDLQTQILHMYLKRISNVFKRLQKLVQLS